MMNAHRPPTATRLPELSPNTIARVDNLSLHFRTDRGTVKALNNVNFDIYEGETLALVGETGCGKSVTARSFLQLVPTPPGYYQNGHVFLRGSDRCPECDGSGCNSCGNTGRTFIDLLSIPPTEMRKLRGRRIALIFQEPSRALNPSLKIETHLMESILTNRGKSILEEVGVPANAVNSKFEDLFRRQASADRTILDTFIAKFPPIRNYRKEINRAVRELAIEVLDDTQIPQPEDILNRYPHELSGGMQQRVMIAMALVGEPDLLIADEPTTALDVTIQARILKLVQELQEKYNTSVLYITHNLSLVKSVVDRVAVMYAGTIVEIGDVDDVYDQPLHPYTNGLLNCVPSLSNEREKLVEIQGSVPDMVDPPSGCRFVGRCPFEMEHCEEEVPPWTEEADDHWVACHLYPESGDPPHPDGRGGNLNTTREKP